MSAQDDFRGFLVDAGLAEGAMRLLASVRAAPSDEPGGLVPSIDLAAELSEDEIYTTAVLLAWLAVAQERRAERLSDEIRRIGVLVAKSA